MAKKSTSKTRKKSKSTAKRVNYRPQFERELGLIKENIKFLEKENFYVSQEVQEAVNKWSNRKRIDKKIVEKLKQIDYLTLKQNSSYLDKETGELIPNEPGNANTIFYKQVYSKNEPLKFQQRELKYLKLPEPVVEKYDDDTSTWESKQISLEDLPNFSMYEKTKQLIMNGPDMVAFHKGGTKDEWVTEQTSEFKNKLVSMLDDLYGSMGDDFDEYMEDNWGELESDLGEVYDDSRAHAVQQGMADAVNILSGPGTMSSDSAFLAGEIGDSLGL